MKPLYVLAALAAAWIIGCGGEVDEPTTSGSGLASGECNASNPCANNGLCVYPSGDCSPNAKGNCVQIFSCDGPPQGPMCQCNGEVLEDPDAVCQLASKPTPKSDVCATGTFACGTLMCKRNAEVCVVTQGGAPGTEPSYACSTPNDVGGTCVNGIPDCSCLQPAQCGGGSCCTADADHQETITINLP